MGGIFLKAFFAGLFKQNAIHAATPVQKQIIRLHGFAVDKKNLEKYNQVCGFASADPPFIPISYFQTLFTGLLGTYITSGNFPVSPLGLIHTFQSFHQMRPVSCTEILDLNCSLAGISLTSKGTESKFSLEARVDNELVWQGISLFLTKTGDRKKNKPPAKDTVFLKTQENIIVPSGTGRKYAAVSGDYNPHHLFNGFAKLFGFKKAIAHGMWSLARVMAGLDRYLDCREGPVQVEARFKRPVLIPARLTLGYEAQQRSQKTGIHFELRDAQTRVPHLKGHLMPAEYFKQMD